MSANLNEFLAAVAKSSLPTVLWFILGGALVVWYQGYGEISFSKPEPWIGASGLALVFLGFQCIYEYWKTPSGYWASVPWDDNYKYGSTKHKVDYGKFLWEIKTFDTDVLPVGAVCKKCKGKILIKKNSKLEKVMFYCPSCRFGRRKMVFRGTKDTVLHLIKQKLVSSPLRSQTQ